MTPEQHAAIHDQYSIDRPVPAPEPPAVELLPCPFCGSIAVGLVEGYEDMFWAACRLCGADTAIVDAKAQAIAAWNQRSDATLRQAQRTIIELSATVATLRQELTAAQGRAATPASVDRLVGAVHELALTGQFTDIALLRAYRKAYADHIVAGKIAHDSTIPTRAAVRALVELALGIKEENRESHP